MKNGMYSPAVASNKAAYCVCLLLASFKVAI
jgi:hypothetical protein